MNQNSEIEKLQREIKQLQEYNRMKQSVVQSSLIKSGDYSNASKYYGYSRQIKNQGNSP